MSLIGNKEQFSDDHIKFEINSNETVKTSLVNGLRRIMLTNIPVYAITREKVEFTENTSLFDDDYLAHRLSYVPIINTLDKDYNNIELKLEKENTEHEQIKIFLRDFTANEELDIKDIVKYPGMLLTVLNPGQKISCTVKFEYGTCKEYASNFSPVSTAVYYYKYDETSEDLNSERDYKKDKLGNPKVYVMSIESTGHFTSDVIFNMAIDRYKYILNNIKEDIIHKKGAIVEFHRNKRAAGVRLVLKNENETVGNILTQYILDMDKEIICGYTQPHPFEKYIYIDINYKNNTFNQIREVFIQIIDKINKILDDLKKDFSGSSTKKVSKKSKTPPSIESKEVDSSLNDEETTDEEDGIS